MLRRNLALIVSAMLVFAATPAFAQLAAFPGAEGAAQYVTGGRGGDVYYVTNLNDSGVGSLRYGIDNASGPRTILFNVGGTIELQSSLDFSGASNITIAGQTAPGGGITLAGDRFRVDDADNVIVQFLRIRPGVRDGGADPDALWVQESTNVMIDHVTAAWGVDENLSVTHDSNNVTVQWSFITQGLFDGNHTEGDGHSYGSLINGGAYTFHHNLYAHNKSRNPRPQDANDRYLRLDFVNNVLYNPQDQFGYSDGNDPYDMNYVGNYGVKGPQTNNSINWLLDVDDNDSHIHLDGNVMDMDRDGLIDGTAAGAAQVLRPGSPPTLFGSRLSDTQLPLVNTTSAEQAYIQVLSRAGASATRDGIDMRTVRTIMNQLRGHIDTPAEWGGNPAIPNGTPPSDANNDGVPDYFAAALGFNPTDNIGSTAAPDGYTYLEKYLHSLAAHAYAPVNTEAVTISTAFGNGADAQVNENGGAVATSSGNGTAQSLNALWSGASGSSNQAIVLRFDLSAITPGSVTDARLDLSAFADITGSHQFKVYGLEHDADGWDWDEAAIQFSDAPGLVFDGDSRTLGINPTYNFSNPLDLADLLTLGILDVSDLDAGETVGFDGLNLAVFLNLAAYFQGTDQDGLVTIILEQINNTGSTAASFYSKEGDALLAPRLVLQATPVPEPGSLAAVGGLLATLLCRRRHPRQ